MHNSKNNISSMDSTVVSTGTEGKTWGGGNQPLKSSYGKMMMWFFIVSDALTFSGFLAAYGFSRFKFIDYWPIADEVFTHVPFLHGQELPMIYVAFMTFVLIMSSVTMVLAVDAGHQMKKNKVIWYMFFTIIGGVIFVGSQAWEWATFIQGDYGAVQTKGGNILQFGEYKTIDGEEVFKRVAVEEFTTAAHSERTQHQSKKWNMVLERKQLTCIYNKRCVPRTRDTSKYFSAHSNHQRRRQKNGSFKGCLISPSKKQRQALCQGC